MARYPICETENGLVLNGSVECDGCGTELQMSESTPTITTAVSLPVPVPAAILLTGKFDAAAKLLSQILVLTFRNFAVSHCVGHNVRVTLISSLAISLGSSTISASELTAEQIMARVAANQERSEKLRSSIVYEQGVSIRLLQGNGKASREERHIFTVTPTPDGTEKELVRFEGSLRHNGELTPYAEPHHYRGAVDIDAILSEVLLEFTEEGGPNGVDGDFFPLTHDEQKKYLFRRVGEEEIHGHNVYRISFSPRKKGIPKDRRADWKGDIFVDRDEFQPVYVTTDMARKVPLGVRILLGTNVRQVGFALRYEEIEDGLWFPVSYGGEFHVRAVFFYGRTATLSLVNRDFRRTDVESEVTYSGP